MGAQVGSTTDSPAGDAGATCPPQASHVLPWFGYFLAWLGIGLWLGINVLIGHRNSGDRKSVV